MNGGEKNLKMEFLFAFSNDRFVVAFFVMRRKPTARIIGQ